MSVKQSLQNLGGRRAIKKKRILIAMTFIELFERTVVWPQNLINQAKAAVGAFRGIFNQIQGLAQISVASATLPATQQLERTLLSGDANLITSVDAHYAAVYSALPPSS